MTEQFTEYAQPFLQWLINHGIKIAVIVIAAILIKSIAKKSIQRIVKAATHSDRPGTDEGEIKRMNTIVRIFSWTVSVLITVIAFMMIAQEFGIQIAPLLASAGIVGVAIGFGGQYLVRDVITGFFLIFENQYRIGDVVNMEGLGGVVEDISLRVTTLRDMNGTVHYIPHGEIKKVSNLSKQFAKVNLNVGVSYRTDLNKLIEVINRVGSELASDPNWKDLIDEAPAFLRVDSFDDSAISVKIVGVTKPLQQWSVTGELRKRIKEAFDAEGIEIPFPQRVIHTASNE
ncbi:MAG: mechanosensitive ion channel family protein [Bacteroidales bacterium]|jgi:small conductance mechanosensitive channel|nr:mechanosensitive ion channel family protein [Bacteroidales bacterium]